MERNENTISYNLLYSPTTMFPEILYAFICFLFLLFLRSKIIDKPTSWPFLGMLPALALNLHRVHDWSVYALEKVGGTSVLKGPWFTNMANIVFTTDPENVRYIFNTNFSNYPKGSQFKEIFDILGDGIFNADLDSWKTQRKSAHQIVRKKQFLEFVEQSCRSKVETGLLPVVEHVLQQNMVVDLQEVFKRLTFDMTVTIISGIDPCCLGVAFEEFPYVEAMDIAEEAIFYRHVVPVSVWKLQRFLGIGTEKKLVKAKESLDQFIAKCISAKREKMKEEKNTGVVGADLLTSYMSDPAVSDKFLRDTMLNFMEAGRGGVGAALTWFFWLVSQNPDVEQKIIEDLRPKAKDGNLRSFKVFDMEELNGLVYLHGAFCECLRLFPPVPFEHKLPVCSDILPSGHKVDSRTKIVPLIYAMGRMNAVWGKDCLEFKPERWITEEGGIKYVPSYKFMAFSSGPRICIGKETAFIQLKMVAATLLYNYSIQVLETSHSMSPTLSVILYMNKGMNVRIKRRF